MTSWSLTYYSIVHLCIQLCFSMEALFSDDSPLADSKCWSPGVTSCTECLRRGPQCAWCFMEDYLDGGGPSYRCDLPARLLRRGCEPEFMEHSDTDMEVNYTIGNQQVSPPDIRVSLTPGSETSFIMSVKQLDRYPVDLYYLVDVSASMQENLDHLKTVGVALSLRMTEHSSDLWLGFGSFVDKPVSPYINVHPSKINNPCSDYEIHCRPAHGFHHVLSMTGNISEFTRVIKHQRISGNMDTPEGGLDAMLQAAVCQKAVGWRPDAKRLLLLMTDQPSHLALDSRLAGIVMPHDGRCHLENNVYTGSTRMDHPSVGQLSDKLLENHIYSIFAVEKQQYQWYEELVSFLPGSYLGKIGFFQAQNLIELVVDAYKRLLSEVALSVSVDDRAVSRYWSSVSPLCPEGSTAQGQSCSGVQPGQTVYFNITIGLHSCPDECEDKETTMIVRPVGYNESSTVRIHSKCCCGCGTIRRCHKRNQSPCTETEDVVSLEQIPEKEFFNDSNRDTNWNCRSDASDVDCSGRGVCECGQCVCEQNRLGTIYGKYCEIDDYSCPYNDGLLCGGHGMCVSGECVCDNNWSGDSCSCPVSTATCQSPNGLLCSGHGRCVCGECVCDSPQYYGKLCERCPACQSTCQSYWNCVDCHLSHGLTQTETGVCNSTCTSLVGYTDDISGKIGELGSHCMYISNDNCRYRFQTSSEAGQRQLHISTRPECASNSRLVGTFLSVCALTVLCGLVVVAMSRLLLQKRSWLLQGTTEDGHYHCTGKDLSYIPTTNEKTVTYRRDNPPDQPVEMNIHVPRMPLCDTWRC